MRMVKIAVTAVSIAVWALIVFVYNVLDQAAGDKPPKQNLTGGWPVRWFL